ncbi:MAG TPA: hypothetical protein PLW02_08985, partial [Verrucomicrobiota bacterium]|nr:hypothetical protein [Verrucomicrobiota bacterium]
EYLIGKNKEMPGLTDYLLGKKSLSEVVVRHKNIQNLEWMADGTNVPNPTELLAQDELIRLFEEASIRYDKIVIDSAPVHVASDTLLLASKFHSTILVVRGGKTPIKAVTRSIQLLKNSDARLTGVVLNLLPTGKGRGYYYHDYYYHGYYSDYYKKGSKNKVSKTI